MTTKGPDSKNDVLLKPYLWTSDPEEAQRLLGALICQHVRPMITPILASECHRWRGSASGNLRVEDVEDLSGEAETRVFNRLRALREGVVETPIANLAGYAATVARRSLDQHLRNISPERTMLKNRLRYLLRYRPSFALWEQAGGEWVCGLASWKGLVHPARLGPLPLCGTSNMRADFTS
jgi:hypothetical protein